MSNHLRLHVRVGIVHTSPEKDAKTPPDSVRQAAEAAIAEHCCNINMDKFLNCMASMQDGDNPDTPNTQSELAGTYPAFGALWGVGRDIYDRHGFGSMWDNDEVSVGLIVDRVYKGK